MFFIIFQYIRIIRIKLVGYFSLLFFYFFFILIFASKLVRQFESIIIDATVAYCLSFFFSSFFDAFVTFPYKSASSILNLNKVENVRLDFANSRNSFACNIENENSMKINFIYSQIEGGKGVKTRLRCNR